MNPKTILTLTHFIPPDELIKTIEPARSFAEDADIDDSGKHRKLPMIEIQGACIDPVAYQVITAFHEPAM